MTGSRRWILAAAALGLVLRLAFALFYWVGQPLTHDEREYLAIARSISRGEGVRYPPDEPAPGTSPRFGRAPGYPAFLAALGVSKPYDQVPARVKVAQALVGTAGILLIAALARRAAGESAGVAAAFLAAVYPPLVWIPAYVLSECLFSTIALAAAALLGFSVGSRHHTRWLVAAALTTGVAILVRPALLVFLPLAGLWMLFQRGRPLSSGLRDAVLFGVITMLCVLPWTLRNHREYGRWLLVASDGGVTFWTGNHPLAIGEGDLAANPPLKQAEIEFRRSYGDMTAEQLEPYYYRDALAWIRAHPGEWLWLEVRKLFYTVVPIGPSYTLHSAKYLAASVAAYGLVLPFALVGIWRLRRAPGTPTPLWLMALATVLTELVFFPQERFRIPVIDPALIVAAASAVFARKA